MSAEVEHTAFASAAGGDLDDAPVADPSGAISVLDSPFASSLIPDDAVQEDQPSASQKQQPVGKAEAPAPASETAAAQPEGAAKATGGGGEGEKSPWEGSGALGGALDDDAVDELHPDNCANILESPFVSACLDTELQLTADAGQAGQLAEAAAALSVADKQ